MSGENVVPNRLDVRAHDWALIRETLARYTPPGFTVCAFGSRVTGHARRGSDLDLAFDGSQPLSSFERASLADAFEDSLLPYRVDIVDLHEVEEDLRVSIVASAIRLAIRTA